MLGQGGKVRVGSRDMYVGVERVQNAGTGSVVGVVKIGSGGQQ